MDIQGISGSGSIDPIDPKKKVNRSQDVDSTERSSPSDEVDVSNTGKLLNELRKVSQESPIRTEKIQQLSKQIQNGNFETQERLSQLADKLANELL